LKIKSGSPEQTEEIGIILGRHARAGDLIFLSGNLGVGKTQLVRGITLGIGSTDPVSSPTFALVNYYSGPICIYHLDLYRLGPNADIEVLDIQEMIESEAMIIIEWGEWLQAEYPQHLEIKLEYGELEDERRMRFIPRSARYEALCEELKRDYACFRD
jgi:tRNA threonylcarbamoyladenosine biosynthesis protein TsaE